MTETVPDPYLGKDFVGYVVNSSFSDPNQQTIAELGSKFVDEFGDAVYLPKPEWLHITLMDWLAPLVDYGRGKDRIFSEIFDSYDQALQDTTQDIGPIDISFNQISVSPEAIFIRGTDDGQYHKIRQAFLGRVSLLPNTKLPPKIIHSTIARFTKPIPLEPVQRFAASQAIDLQQTVDNFRLLRTTGTRMEALKVIKRYYL